MDEKKKRAEWMQMRNLLTNIHKEYGDNILLEDFERPDFRLSLPSGVTVGIEITQCCPSANSQRGCNMKHESYKETICKQFLENEVLKAFTQTNGMNIIIYPTSEIYNESYSIDDYCKEIEQHLIVLMSEGKDFHTKLIKQIKIIHRGGKNNVVQFCHIARRDAVKAQELLNVIIKKEKKAKEYDQTDEIWLCVYLPWQEKLHPYWIDYRDMTEQEFNHKLSETCFERIYITSEFEMDFLRVK